MTHPGTGADEPDEGKPDPALFAAARELLDHSEIANVTPVNITASLVDEAPGGEPIGVRLTLEPSVTVGLGSMANRFQYQIDLLDEAEATVARLDFTLQVEYEIADDYEPDQEAAEFIARTTGLFGSYPYARELAQNLTTRLQLDPLVLGLLPRGMSEPKQVTWVRRRGA